MREIQINLIEGYENVKDQYWINELGEVLNTNTWKKLIPCADGRGYPQYQVMGKTKKYIVIKIHKILAKWLYYSILFSSFMILFLATCFQSLLHRQ